MRRSILTAFDAFPAEAGLLSRLLCGYSNLEVGLMHCVYVARDDLDSTLKAIFRTRSVRDRVRIADGLARHIYHQLKLGTEFEMAIGAVQYCLNVRNRYAHRVWYDDRSGRLTLVNIEEAAKKNEFVDDLGNLTKFYVDVPLLTAQEDYFVYTDQLLSWTNYEGRVRRGWMRRHALEKPGAMRRPAEFLE